MRTLNECDHEGTEERLGSTDGFECAVPSGILGAVTVCHFTQIGDPFGAGHSIEFAAGRLAPFARFGHGIKDFGLGFHR